MPRHAHVDGSTPYTHLHRGRDWAWCCEHAASDDFRGAIRLLQPHLCLQHLSGRCCSLRPAEVYIRSHCASSGRGADVAVRVKLGAGGASLFKLQVQSVTGIAIASDSDDELLFELSMPSGATIQLRGMPNYGVASYCAALGQLLDGSRQQHQQASGPPASPAAATCQQRTAPGAAAAASSADSQRPNRSLTHARRPYPTRGGDVSSSGGGCLSKGPRPSFPSAAAAAAASGSARLAQSVCNAPYREGLSFGGSGGGGRHVTASKAAAARAAATATGSSHISDWLRAADMANVRGGGAVYGIGARDDDDDLMPDVDAASAAGGGGGGSAAVRVTAWVRACPVAHAAEVQGRLLQTSVSSVAAAAMGWRDGASSVLRPRLAAAAAAADGDDDVASGSDASKLLPCMRCLPGAAKPRRNAALLRLLGLQDEGRSLQLPVPEPPGSDGSAEPDGPLLFDEEECRCVSVLGLHGEAGAVGEPGWEAGGFGYKLLPPGAGAGVAAAAAAMAAPVPVAVAALVGGGCPAMTGAGSYSLEGSGQRDSLASAGPAQPRGPRVPTIAQLLLRQQQQQQQCWQERGRAVAPAAVKVLNLLSAAPTVTPAAAPATGCCTDFAAPSSIRSLEWYGEGDRVGSGGGCAPDAVREPNPGCLHSTNVLRALFEDDDIINLDKLSYGDRAAAAAATATAAAAVRGIVGDSRVYSFCWRGGGGDPGGAAAPPSPPPNLLGWWLSREGGGAPPPPPPPPLLLLTSLTADAVWL